MVYLKQLIPLCHKIKTIDSIKRQIEKGRGFQINETYSNLSNITTMLAHSIDNPPSFDKLTENT